MKLTRVGVDLAKHVFQVHGVDGAECAIWCKRRADTDRLIERPLAHFKLKQID